MDRCRVWAEFFHLARRVARNSRGLTGYWRLMGGGMKRERYNGTAGNADDSGFLV